MPTDEMFGLRRKLLENSYISVAKSKTGDDGQLPARWQLLTCWHFTPVILTAEFIALADLYTSTYGPILTIPKALTQNPLEYLAGAALR